MSHEIKTPSGNRVWGLLLADREDEIEEADILAIEAEARQPDSEALRLLRELVEVYGGNYEPEGRLIDMSAVADKARAFLAALPPSDPPALDWRVTGSLTVLTEWAEGEEGEGCHWCLFSEGHEEGCPVGIARAVLDERLSAQPEAQPAEDADEPPR